MSRHDDTRGVRMEEIHQKNKAANIAADSFAQHQSDVHTRLSLQEETTGNLASSVRNLEQQVKAIARVMAAQNVQKLQDNIKMAQEEMQRNFMQYVNDKQKDIMGLVEREVAEVVDMKNGLGKKIDGVEQRVMTLIGARLEEASHARHAMREELEKVQESIQGVPAIVEKNAKIISSLDAKIAELKKEIRQVEVDSECANQDQDKQVAALVHEVKTSLETARDKLSEESKVLSKSQKKYESIFDDSLKAMRELIEREVQDRQEQFKKLGNEFADRLHNQKLETQKQIGSQESEMERRVKPFYGAIADVKGLVEEERTHREAADLDLARKIEKERKERDLDEERLLSMISSCTQTLAKMQHRPA